VTDGENHPPHTFSLRRGGVRHHTVQSKRPQFFDPPDAGVSNLRFICVRTPTPVCGQEKSMSSGSRLPGDSESNDRHRTEERAETRLSGDLAYRLGEFLDATGEKKSAVLRDALDEYLPSSENSAYVLPRDGDLADAYLQLADEDEKRVYDYEEAVDILANTTHPNTKKPLIRKTVIERLDGSGLLAMKGGHVAVHPLTLREEVTDGE